MIVATADCALVLMIVLGCVAFLAAGGTSALIGSRVVRALRAFAAWATGLPGRALAAVTDARIARANAALAEERLRNEQLRAFLLDSTPPTKRAAVDPADSDGSDGTP